MFSDRELPAAYMAETHNAPGARVLSAPEFVASDDEVPISGFISAAELMQRRIELARTQRAKRFMDRLRVGVSLDLLKGPQCR